MDPQSIDEFMNYILALKQSNAQTINQKDKQINQLTEELKNTKITSKPIKGQKQ